MKGRGALTALATSILEKNTAALARASADAAREVLATEPRPDVRFIATDDGVLSAELGSGETAVSLASRRRPLEEARKLAGSVDLTESAVFIVSGFGVGHHVEALARRLGKTGIVVVFEPDVALLRAVLENIDCSGWLSALNVAIVINPDDPALVSRIIEGAEGLVAMGVTLIEHPSSRVRIGESARVFHRRFVDVVRAVKMTVVTTMVQVKATLRNLTQNLDRYATSPGIEHLRHCCPGAPAIVVSAGPSLARNIDLLTQPWVRDRFVIIAVQTALKPLLKRGIKPHFVTALDHSEISRRFYEGLTAADVEGVTLVVDPKVNPAVLDAWPRGAAICFQSDKYLDILLGPALTRPKGHLKPGATVAHLAYYLARHLGANPVILMGQDLGFTDGQYYSAGAAIHNVWAGELNEFNTLEMLEWQRIKRMGQHLRRETDALGRPIYTDEQMATYLVQFERDFREDAEHGLSIIDCTEGGVRKRHTEIAPLTETLEKFRDHGRSPVRIPDPREGVGGASGNYPSLRKIEDRVTEARAGAFRIAEVSRSTDMVLAEIAEHQKDQPRVNRLIGRTEELGRQVSKFEPALSLTHVLNQSGSFNRVRADRAIQLQTADGRLSATDRQLRQVERDRLNVQSLARNAEDLAKLLDDCLRTLRGGERVIREHGVSEAQSLAEIDSEALAVSHRTVRIAAVIPVFADLGCLAEDFALGLNLIETTIAAVAKCTRLGRLSPSNHEPERVDAPAPIVILTDDVERTRRWIRRVPERVNIEFLPAAPGLASRRSAVRAARMLGPACWRGGIANLTVYDELFEPHAMAQAMQSADPPIDAALLVGPDWCAVDPALCDSVIERFLDEPRDNRIVFTQAAPGLCGCVLGRGLVEALEAAGPGAGTFASIGGVLGYIPSSPILDMVNTPDCVAVDPAVRDSGERLIACCRRGREGLLRHLKHADAAATIPSSRHLVLELARGWERLPGDRARREIEQLAERCDDGVVTLRGTEVFVGDDPLSHADVRRLCEHARQLGVAVHVRTPLTAEVNCDWLIDDSTVDVVSVDLLAQSEEVYRAVTSRDGLFRVRERLELLLARSAAHGRESGEPTVWRKPWIVPRITRCDAAYPDIELFYHEWLLRCGWAVIDPLPDGAAGPTDRITPLPPPEWVRRLQAESTRVVCP